MGDRFWSDGFGPMLPGTAGVPFGDLRSARREARHAAVCRLHRGAGAGGGRHPRAGRRRICEAAQALCRRYGTLFVLDEVQTGMYRTGPFLAAHHFGLEPDMVVLAKALSGGLVPVGAVLMTDAVSDPVYGSLKRAIVHTSTFSENALAMRAGLATLDVLESERLGERGRALGELLRERLREALAPV